MAGKMYSVGIYARLSVEGSDRKNESIQTQIEIAKEYMKEQGDMELYDCYSDLGRTGTNFERDGFERLMADVRRRRVDCVIVKDFSRFGRNYIETGNYIQKIFPFLGVRFVSVTDGFDSLFAGNDDLGVNLKNLANEMYARDIALKVKSSKRTKRESGSYVGGIPPYGYRAEWVCGKKCLFAEEGSAEIVKWIFSQYDEGRSLKEIAESLYAQGIHRPTEYRRYHHLRRQPGEALHQWPGTSIKALLTNAVYTGRMKLGNAGGGNGLKEENNVRQQGKACWAESKGTGSKEAESSRPGSREPGYKAVQENTHEAIVSREQFCRIAERFERGAEKAKGRSFGVKQEEKDIFDGVLFCGRCGKRLGRRGSVKRSGSGREVIRCTYFCRNANKIDEFCCDTCAVSRDVLTEMVNAILRQESVLNDIRPGELVRENMRCAGEQKAQTRKEINVMQKRLKAFEWAGSEQYRKYREGIISRETFQEWRALNGKEAEKAKITLEEKRRRIDEIDTGADRQSAFLEELMKFPGNAEPDRELISRLIQRISLYADKRVEITFRFVPKSYANMAEAGDDSGRKA